MNQKILPSPNWNYPEWLAEYSPDAKKKKASEIYADLTTQHPYISLALKPSFWEIMERCQYDFKLASLVAYKIAVDLFKDNIPSTPFAEELKGVNRAILPVYYCGGDICLGRVFSINHCAFSSPDSIIGFRNSEYGAPQEYFKVLKGLRLIGTHHNWILFKLDRNSTDDMTGMLYSALEKNFTIEFAHFPHDGERRFVYRWEDS